MNELDINQILNREEKASNINTQDNAFGKDRLGTAAMKKDDQEG